MFCGIDPGIRGALAFIDKLGALVHVQTIPLQDKGKKTKTPPSLVNVKEVAKLHEKFATIVTALEDVGGRSGEGSSSNNKFVKAIGALYGVSECLNLVVWVSPQSWKRHFDLLGKDKEASRALAIARFPLFTAEFTPKRLVQTLKQCQDKAEAALIALWYWETRGRLILEMQQIGEKLDA